MPFRALQHLPPEKLQMILEELQNGARPRTVARSIQQELVEFRAVLPWKLVKTLERCKRDLLTRGNVACATTRADEQERRELDPLRQHDDRPEQPLPALHDSNYYRIEPVGVEEFITSECFLNKKEEIYPLVMEHLIELNSGGYVEAVLSGGIGSGKTTIAIYTNAYQLYRLSCMPYPQRQFGLDPSSEILLIFQSLTKQLAKGLDYQRFRSIIEGSTYFREKFPFDRDLQSKLVFPNRIEVVPVSGTQNAAIGQNVIGGLIDELNYMAVVDQSKQSVDKGLYDQATAVYNSISRRRKSRFLKSGQLPGILCLVSSKKYPGQFTDQKVEETEKELKETGRTTVYVYDKRVWEIKPGSYANSEWFHVFKGDMTRKPRILRPDEEVPDSERALVMAIPSEYRNEFEKDIINALREVAGVSTLARHPFFIEVEKVHAAFAKRPSLFSQSPVDFVETRVQLLKQHFYKPELPRFVHGDLAISGDSAGLAIGTVTGFVDVNQYLKDRYFPTNQAVQSMAGEEAYMPAIRIDGVLEIRAPKGGEILFWKVREVIVKLRSAGLNIRWVTFDQFQSKDSQQLLRQQGFATGQQSIDTVPCTPYDLTKRAAYEGRLDIPHQPQLLREMISLEKDPKTGRVNHPANGSKDCADALAGVVYGLTTRRAIWSHYGIMVTMAPPSLLELLQSSKVAKSNLIETSR